MQPFKQTQNKLFFGEIPVILNEPSTFNACYQKLLHFLPTQNISHKLPISLKWLFSTENPESFVHLNIYEIAISLDNTYTITGHIRQHEPYHIEHYFIENYLSIKFCSTEKENFEITFAFFDGDLKGTSLANDTAYYYIETPLTYKTAFEEVLNSFAGGIAVITG